MRFTLIVLLVAALLGGYVFLTHQVGERVGNVKPAVLPPAQDITTYDDDLPFSLPDEFSAHVFQADLEAVRDLVFTPGGTLLASIPKQGQVIALPDADQDGRADKVVTILDNLNLPHGLAIHDGALYVAEETKVSRYHWDEGSLEAALDRHLFDLPRGGRHTSRTMQITSDGTLFVSLGSRCDVCFEDHPWIGTIIASDIEGAEPRVYATGLRNAVFLQLQPQTELLWATEMGRDWLGDDLPPDEIVIVREGEDHGWPVCYGDRVYDEDFGERDPSYCDQTSLPAYNLPAHVAPLGLTFIESDQFPSEWQGDLLVALHGSWNSSVPVGYKIVRLDVEGESVAGAEDFMSDFLQGDQAIARPVDVVFDEQGSLYISDDKGGSIFKVVATQD